MATDRREFLKIPTGASLVCPLAPYLFILEPRLDLLGLARVIHSIVLPAQFSWFEVGGCRLFPWYGVTGGLSEGQMCYLLSPEGRSRFGICFDMQAKWTESGVRYEVEKALTEFREHIDEYV